MHGAPAYIAEMSPSNIRGLLVSLKEAAIVVGILLGYLVGYSFQNEVSGWKYVYGIAMFPAILEFCTLYFYLPPSPRWLLLRANDNETVKNSIRFIYPNERIVNEIFHEIQNNLSNEKSSLNNKKIKTLNDCKDQLILGFGLVTLQQTTGQPSVLYYANEIFTEAGVGGIGAILLGIFKLVMTLCTVFTVDKYGRRKLLFVGIGVMILSLFLLTFSFLGYDQDAESDSLTFQQIMILSSMLLYVGGYQIGFGPIVWLIISEIFPLEIRGPSISLMVSSNFLWNLIVTFLFPIILASFGASFTFCVFMLVASFALYFTFHNLPETKGLTLEQIELQFIYFKNAKKGDAKDTNLENYDEINESLPITQGSLS